MSGLLPEPRDPNTAHCTIIAVDIAGFGLRDPSNDNQVRMREGMYKAMHAAFDAAGIPWSSCRDEDRGDGMLVLAAAEVRKRPFADHLPSALAEELALHNRHHRPRERIRLRLALHSGEVNFDRHGVTGSSINHTYRLLDSDTVRLALGKSAAVLAIISSDWFFEDVIRRNELSRPSAYRQVDVVNKETRARAWIRLVRPVAARRPQAPPRAGQTA
ncbi:hypothetical protein ACFWNN_44515 [Lentzea sp. NPDC058450]|uniref:hypothetical protein n=1 Tax=Lentzea sp. NPDC058450 TaxID=3346505 RepID=UPI00364AFCFE